MAKRNLEATLQRMLGPGHPEVSCEECFEELDRYGEAEMAGTDTDGLIPRLGAHLDGRSACAEDHGLERRFGSVPDRLADHFARAKREEESHENAVQSTR
jgi:hypothetical protein